MTPENLALAAQSLDISSHYLDQGRDAERHRAKQVAHLLQQRKLPETGWREADIETLLWELGRMDSNQFPANCGVGEREGRIQAGLVSRRHFGLAHGIGRSGDLCEVQPKAAGSSTLNKLTNALVLDVIRRFGVRSCQGCFLVPVATGLALTLCLLALRPVRVGARYVIWSRIDQKSCFKSILCAGFEPVVIELKTNGHQLETDVEAMAEQILALGPDNIACIMTTTSCFAPRAADDLPAVARLARTHQIPHLVNNAYGIQSSKCMHLLEESGRIGGPHHVFVQSTDKNFMVPVGGAIIAGFDKSWIRRISQSYPGRASSSPTTDVFITLMSLGYQGYHELVKARKARYEALKARLSAVAEQYGEVVYETKGNPISLGLRLHDPICFCPTAMTLHTVPDPENTGQSVSALGSMLFTRGVSGTRVLTGKDCKTIEGHTFEGWGSHSGGTPCPYLTAAAAIGMTEQDIDLFIHRLTKVMQSTVKPKP
eukprot:snap_masked-scaffold261_size233860-processed-gene-1.22 protein:Tk10687 transcript:snap_masked-scaffold261_size233860-processed-gene-1.22-mRNA-1 annotation:"o-phosphoseryl-trna selenium transferase"